MSLVEVKDLKKVFNGNVAVDNVSFEVKEKEIFGLLGPNGAARRAETTSWIQLSI